MHQILSGLLAASLSVSWVSFVTLPAIAQATDSPTNSLPRLIHQAGQQIQEGQFRQAFTTLQQALHLSRQMGDPGQEARVLTLLGRVAITLGNSQQAVEVLNQALPLHRTVGNPTGEAATLNNLGLAYHSLGQTQKALDYYQQGLALVRTLGDRGGGIHNAE
ncbi:tetratricopeptide repeat protein [Neosynechococcus sphagnicola]|uniref:tetratricopeptide repeat protein n=1 Tax=Neosynechococcus sphagnicola TaxID=1501145 RepID=UPI00068C7C95|nr:tetratricopeptide repeat protein [Neosynechococcus sphagnicola]